MAEAGAPLALVLAMPVLVFKLAIGGALLAVLEGVSAKMRIFRVPEFLATAFAGGDRPAGQHPAGSRLARFGPS